MGKKKGKLSAALGATAGGLAWALAVLLLNRVLGWPDSWPTLVATGGLAFLASALVSGILRKPWAAHAGVICALALLVACPLAGWPFQVGREKTVWRYVEFSAYLLETEDNGPIDNVIIACRLPAVNNEIFGPRVAWGLYYLDENNLWLETAFEGRAQGWVMREVWERVHPDRTKPPEILEDGIDQEIKMCALVIDKLYPREVVKLEIFVEIPEKKAGSLSLREFGENYSGGCLRSLGDNFGKKIREQLILRFWKPVENGLLLLEGYQRELEFYGEFSAKLYPI